MHYPKERKKNHMKVYSWRTLGGYLVLDFKQQFSIFKH